MTMHQEGTLPPLVGVEFPEQLLTERDLAFRWQVSVKTLQNTRVTGSSLRFLKIGRAVRYRLLDVQAYEAAHSHTSTSNRSWT